MKSTQTAFRAVLAVVAILFGSAPASALYGGRNDDDTLEANVVVALGGLPAGCTGTLITPLIVLTASHCINGSKRPAGNGKVCDPDNLPSIFVGANASAAADLENPRRTQSVETRIVGCANVDEYGIDMALVFLDPAKPVVEQAKIVRPSLASPSAGGKDDNGGDYGSIGIAGWSPYGHDGVTQDPTSLLNRQVAIFNKITLHHYPGNPDEPAGQYWEHTVAGVGETAGDSGGPLFVVRPDGTRDPIGVYSGSSTWPDCGLYGCSYWTDITRGFNAQWIRDHVMDSAHGGHSPKWLVKHGKVNDFWYGEVDYTGPCDQAKDQDCDHWYNEHDNCPLAANPDQKDSNDDGIGDACSPCPWDPTNDADHDGVCDDTRAGADPLKKDNCPLIYNPDQANCNVDAELVRRQTIPGLPILGDACDPVVCPKTVASITSQFLGPSAYNPSLGGFASGRRFHDRLVTTKIAPHDRDAQDKPTSFRLNGVPSDARFCQSNLVLGFRCRDYNSIRDSALLDFPNSASETLLPSKPWHRISLSIKPSRDSGWTWDYDGSDVEYRWLYAEDNRFWHSGSPKVPDPEPSYLKVCTDQRLAGPGTCLDGTLWLHAETPVGATVDFVDIPAQHVGIHGAGLANFYLDLRPDEAYQMRFAGVGEPKHIFIWRTLPDPSPWGERIRAHPGILVTQQPSLAAARFYVLEENGAPRELEGRFSAALTRTLMREDVVWAGAVEPSSAPSNGVDRRAQAIALSADGTRVLDLAVDRRGRLLASSDVGIRLDTPPSSIGPPARSEFVSVFSKAAGGVFVLGKQNNQEKRTGRVDFPHPDLGQDVTPSPTARCTHARSGVGDCNGGRRGARGEQNYKQKESYRPEGQTAGVWLFRPEMGWSSFLIPNVQLGNILAATYSYIDRSLWIIDAGGNALKADMARLIKVDPWVGTSRILGIWPLASMESRYGLSLGQGKTVMLWEQSYPGGQSTLRELQVDDTGELVTATCGDPELSALVQPPILEEDGFDLVLRGTTKGEVHVIVRSKLNCEILRKGGGYTVPR
jgi:hypothetical protein